MTPPGFDLTGRGALVTGGARGLGLGIARGLAAAGARLALLDRDDPSEAAAPLGAHPMTHDLTGLTPERAAAIVADADAALGGCDILVHAAGFLRRAPALDLPQDDWNAMREIHLDAAFLLAQAAARRWSDAGQTGKIVLVASMLSFFGGRNAVAYAAAKSGVAGLTRALAAEWAPLGIGVNALAPGWFATDLTAALRADPDREGAIRARIPAGRWGDPADLAGAAVFLASPASDYVHGVVLPVDGGYRIA